MTKRMNWRNAALASKKCTSVIDEAERHQSDRAARWLAKVEANPKTGKPVKVKR